MEQDQVVKDRAQGAEQETAGMEVEPDHPGKSLSAEMRPPVGWADADDKYRLTKYI